MENMEIIRNAVGEFYKKNARAYLPVEILFNEESSNHVKSIGTSIMAHYWEAIDYSPGSFIKNFLANDLMATLGAADDINQKAIKFYAILKYNLPKPELK